MKLLTAPIPRFQCGVGPDQKRCHIYIVGIDPKMSLCGAVCIARNYKGSLSVSNSLLCSRCFSKAEKQLPPGAALNAETLGVSSIED